MHSSSKNRFRSFRSGLLVGFGISVAILISIGAYAAYSSLGVNATDPLSASKWNELVTYTVPPNAIIAFSGTVCPANWSEYTPARGRFLRGIDPSGSTANDPSGTRVPGNQQTDSLQDHTHYITGESGGNDNVIAFQDSNGDSTYGPGGNPGSRGDAYVYVGGGKAGRFSNETRPKNVAVLYCIKN